MELALAISNRNCGNNLRVLFFQYGGSEKLADVIRPIQKSFTEPTAIFVKRVDDCDGLRGWVDHE